MASTQNGAPLHVSVPSRTAAGLTTAARPVFVVDDSATTRQLIETCLSQIGLLNPVVALDDGAAAIAELDRLLTADVTGLPVLMLLDRQMPEVDGIEVLAWMRRTPGLDDVVVVMLSADAEVRDVNDAYALGVASYLVKPVGFEALGPVLRSLPRPWVLA